MSRFEASPALPLRPFVHSYWGLVRHYPDGGSFTITPDRFVELLFFVDPPLVGQGVGQSRLAPCSLIGLLREPLRLTLEGTVRCAAIRLHAWSAGMFVPVAHGGQPWFDLTPNFAGLVPTVQAILRDGDWGRIAAIFDHILPQRLSSTPPPAALVAARAFASSPDGKEQKVTTPAVARRQGRSRRQVERQVRALTHLSPKQLSSLARFQFVRDTLWARPGTALATLAFEAGYADQAHLTRQFRRYAGQAPLDFLRDCARLRATLRAPDVAFVQDVPETPLEDGGHENPTAHRQPRSR